MIEKYPWISCSKWKLQNRCIKQKPELSNDNKICPSMKHDEFESLHIYGSIYLFKTLSPNQTKLKCQGKLFAWWNNFKSFSVKFYVGIKGIWQMVCLPKLSAHIPLGKLPNKCFLDKNSNQNKCSLLNRIILWCFRRGILFGMKICISDFHIQLLCESSFQTN